MLSRFKESPEEKLAREAEKRKKSREENLRTVHAEQAKWEAERARQGAERAKAAASEASRRRLFEYEHGNQKWEYCKLYLSPEETVGLAEVRLSYVTDSGETLTQKFSAAKKNAEDELLKIASKLGQAGWEMCGSSRAARATGSREKNVFEKGLQDYGHDATIATGSSTTTVMYFKRRLPI